jgi:hypothetical protein
MTASKPVSLAFISRIDSSIDFCFSSWEDSIPLKENALPILLVRNGAQRRLKDEIFPVVFVALRSSTQLFCVFLLRYYSFLTRRNCLFFFVLQRTLQENEAKSKEGCILFHHHRRRRRSHF